MSLFKHFAVTERADIGFEPRASTCRIIRHLQRLEQWLDRQLSAL